jgi:hypothetical protein
MTAIRWNTKMIDSQEAARAEEKPILLDFFNPG